MGERAGGQQADVASDGEIIEGELSPPDDAAPGDGDAPAGQRRPTLVYAALAAGAAVLAVLLLIVWLSSRDDDGGEQPLCLDTGIEDAQRAVLNGDVERIDVLVDSETPLNGLTAIQVHLMDGECRRLPEGADNRSLLYQLLGVVTLYNEEGPQRVEVEYQRQDVPASLLQRSTPTPSATVQPTPTLPVTETPTVEATATPTATPAPTEAPSPQPSPSVAASPSPMDGPPVPSPVASPWAVSADPERGPS
jgi:hypothetical protein